MEAKNMFKCIACGGTNADTRTLTDAKDSEKIEVALCETCGLVQLVHDQTSENLTDYYRTEYRLDYKGTNAPKPHHVFRAGKVAIGRLKKIGRFVKLGARVLDIGAGGGEFAFLASKMGYESSGIDPASGYIEHARENYGADLRAIGLEHLEPTQKYDLITMFHVLEHLPDPRAAVKTIARHLEDGGYLFIEVPDLRSRETSPYNFYHKAHISYFTDLTLGQILYEDYEVCEVNSGRVLQMIMKKRDVPMQLGEQETANQRREALDVSRQRWENKSLKEYLLHGAFMSPFRRISRIAQERSGIQGRTSREILEALL